ncbi:uncharacterized protein LOC143250861 [Tachypleus tridentatus]|uniref:uncharacterized protein LOC143250861 n=1 Tax=Tachypleus tridentatus TaxID=6853 RepID=UPI003FCEFB9D
MSVTTLKYIIIVVITVNGSFGANSNNFLRNTAECITLSHQLREIFNGSSWIGNKQSNKFEASIEGWEAVLLISGFGLFAAGLAHIFNILRGHFYQSHDNLDTAFDAGGKVSVGLTATTIVSQWTWAATLLQSSAVASKYGISGPFWYASGATVQILLFAMLSVQLKIRAPGAKTFLQLIKARFGTKAHLTFCGYAFLTNMIVTAMLMLGGIAVMTTLVRGFSVEYGMLVVVTVIGTYTWIGGLGATFYVSYFNTALIFIIMLIFAFAVYNLDSSVGGLLGSTEKVYDLLNCAIGPEGNENRSYLTVLSQNGLIFGIINIVGNFGTVFVDQSYWQSSVAAKPKDGVWGFLAGGLVWFAVPFTFATTMGLAYVALSSANGKPLLEPQQVDEGLVPPIVASLIMGKFGQFLVLLMILMAVTSTGSAEVIAVTSLLVYDVYQFYLKPFRSTNDVNSCILCGKQRGRWANPRDMCTCESMTFCKPCKEDDRSRNSSKRPVKPRFKCRTHGEFREYYESLGSLKNWCMLMSSLAIIPLTAALNVTGISLGWLYLFMGVLIGSAVIPITLCVFSERLTGAAMMAGAIGGSVVGLTTWMSIASQYEGGLSSIHFLKNTGKEQSMLWGNVVSILSGGIITIVVSIIQNFRMDSSRKSEIWESTRDIDNPLFPWTELYARELNVTGANKLGNRPTLEEVEKTFRSAKWIANAGALVLTLVLIIIWPAGMVAANVLNHSSFRHWVRISQAWAFLAALFIIIIPLYNEMMTFKEQRRLNATVGDSIVEPRKIREASGNLAPPEGKNLNKGGSQLSLKDMENTEKIIITIPNEEENVTPKVQPFFW